MDETLRYWNQQAEAARPQLDESRVRAQEAYEASQAAEQEYQAAKSAADNAPEGEFNQYYQKVLETDAKRKAAQKVFAQAYAVWDRRAHAIKMAEYWGRIAPLNRTLLQTRERMRELSESFGRAIREGSADFESPQYREWKAAWDRYQQALREFGAAVQGRPAPTGASAPEPAPASGGVGLAQTEARLGGPAKP